LVRECWMLSGEVDFILKCVAPDMAKFQDFVTHLTSAPHVRNVRTSLVLHNPKRDNATDGATVPATNAKRLREGAQATTCPPQLMSEAGSNPSFSGSMDCLAYARNDVVMLKASRGLRRR
jgi:hypothetical protein